MSTTGRYTIAAGAAFLVRGLGAAVMLVAQIVIARSSGQAEAGRVAAAMTITALVAVIGRRGADLLIMRRVATQRDPDLLPRELSAAMRSIVVPLTVLAVAVAALARPIATHLLDGPDGAAALLWLALGAIPMGLVTVQGEAIKGLGQPAFGAIVQSLIGPVVSLALLGAGLRTSSAWSGAAIAIGYVAASLGAHLLWLILLRRRAVTSAGTRAPTRERLAFAREARPFYASSVLYLALTSVPTIVLSLEGDPSEVAAYFATDRYTQLPLMALAAINATAGPPFAALWAARDIAGLRGLLRSFTVRSTVAGVVLSGVILALAPWLLGLFGDDFRSAVVPLRLLAVAQLVSVAFGPVTILASMVGQERQQAWAMATAVASVTILSILLVPSHGALGAAIAAATSLVLNKVIVAATAIRPIDARGLRPAHHLPKEPA